LRIFVNRNANGSSPREGAPAARRGAAGRTGASTGRAPPPCRNCGTPKPPEHGCTTDPDLTGWIGPRRRPAPDMTVTDAVAVHPCAARPPSRQRTRTLRGGEPAVWTGRPGGTDELLGRGSGTAPPCRTGTRSDAGPRERVGRRFARTLCDGKSPMQQTRKSQQRSARQAKRKERIFSIPRCAY
jgi:hypothetical protein